MKFKTKLTLLVIFLLGMMAVNTLVGVRQMSLIGQELKAVAQNDVRLMDITSSIMQHQLERSVLLERMIRIAEELAFQDVSKARKDHLLLNAGSTQKGFQKLAEDGALQIIQGKDLVENSLSVKVLEEALKSDLEKVQTLLIKIEKSHISYDAAVLKMMTQVQGSKYELSFEDLQQIQRSQKYLSRQLQKLLELVEEFVSSSLIRAEEAEKQARQSLWFVYFISFILSFIIMIFILKSLMSPLKKLVVGADKIAEDEYDFQLDDDSRDEIGEVSRAFNQMSLRIQEAKEELKDKNSDLASSLETVMQQKEDLAEMNKELDDLTHVISHDIRSPLTGISGYASVLSAKYGEKMDETGKKSLDGIKKGVQKIDAMITDLLELKKMARMENPYQDVHIKDLLDQVMDRLEYKIAEHNVKFSFPPEWPHVVCDRIKMGIVFFNLINNAIKFSSQQDHDPYIMLDYIEEQDQYRFLVGDNGIGIAPEDHDKVFGIFQRLDSAQKFEGTGVGLSLVKNIVESHGGRIWIESAFGQGATFLFTIPKR